MRHLLPHPHLAVLLPDGRVAVLDASLEPGDQLVKPHPVPVTFSESVGEGGEPLPRLPGNLNVCVIIHHRNIFPNIANSPEKAKRPPRPRHRLLLLCFRPFFVGYAKQKKPTPPLH